MSRSIDNRIVEMSFINKQFNDGIRESETILGNFRKTLGDLASNAGTSVASLTGIPQAISGISGVVNTLRGDFGDLGIIGVGALLKIGSTAVDVGAKLVRNLAIGPIADGWAEYELTMGSTQTILNSFTQEQRDSGEALKITNEYLGIMNEYADQTIYKLSDMTSNVGKFTNAGVSLPDATAAMIGISNAAALAGASSGEAARAMYNFAQSMSIGYVNRIDWKSIEIANMATMEFKEQLLESAAAAGTLEKRADGMYNVLTTNAQGKAFEYPISAASNFTDALQYQWLTADALVTTLGEYSDQSTDIGKRAFEAATQVKTFSMLMDTTREAIGTGWADTFQIIFGDFNEAIELWTGISKVTGRWIDSFTDTRNEILQAWKLFGGRDALINMFKLNAPVVDEKIFQPMRDAWSSIFPRESNLNEGIKLAEKTRKFTYSITNFFKNMKPETIEKLRDVYEGFFNRLSVKLEIFKIGVGAAWNLIKILAGPALELLALWGRLWTGFGEWTREFQVFQTIGDIFSTYIGWFIDGVSEFAKLIWKGDWGKAWESIKTHFTNFPTLADDTLIAFNKIKNSLLEFSKKKFRIPFTKIETSLYDIGVKIKDFFVGILDKTDIDEKIKDWFSKINFSELKTKFSEFVNDLKNISLSEVWENVKTKFSELITNIKNHVSNFSLSDIFKDLLSVDFPKLLSDTFSGFSLSDFSLTDTIFNALFAKDKNQKGPAGMNNYPGLWEETMDQVRAKLTKWKEMGLTASENVIDLRPGKGITEGVSEIQKVIGDLEPVADSLKTVWDQIKEVFSSIGKFFKEEFEEFGFFNSIKEVAKSLMMLNIGLAFKDFGSGFKSGISDLTSSISELTSVFSKDKAGPKASFLTKFTIFIGTVTAAAYVLSKVDEEAALEGAKALIAIVGALALAFVAIDNLAKRTPKSDGSGLIPFVGEGGKPSIFQNDMVKLGMFVVIVGSTVKILERLVPMSENVPNLITALLTLMTLMAAVAGAMYLLSNIKTGKDTQLFKLLVQMRIFIYVVNSVVKSLAIIMLLANFGDQLQIGLAVLLGIMIALFALMNTMANMKINAKGMIASSASLVLFGIAINTMLVPLTAFAFLPFDKLQQGMFSLFALLGTLFVGMTLIGHSNNEKAILNAGISIGLIGLAMIPLSGIITVLGVMPISAALQGTIMLAAVLSMLVGALMLLNGKDTLSAGGSILLISAGLSLLIPILVTFAALPFENMIVGILGLAGVMAVMVGAIILISKYAKNLYGASISLLAFGAAITLVAIGISIFSTALIGLALAGPTVVQTLIDLVGGLIELLPSLGTNLALFISNFITTIGEKMPEIINGLKEILLASFVLLKEILPELVEIVLDILIAILEGLASRTITLVDILVNFLVGLIDAIIPRVPEIIAKIIELFDAIFIAIGDALASAQTEDMGLKLLGIIAGFAAVFAFIKLLSGSALAPSIGKAIANIALIGLIIAEIGLIVAAFGALNKIPGLTDLITSGGEILKAIGSAIGDFLGAILEGIVEGVLTAIVTMLPELGTALSQFLENLQPFLEGVQNVTPEMLAGSTLLLVIIVEMAVGSVLGAIGALFGMALPSFGDQLSEFMTNLQPFLEGAKEVDEDTHSGVVKLLLIILEMTAGSIVGAIGTLFSLALPTFGEKLSDFVTNLKPFIDGVKDVDEDVATGTSRLLGVIVTMGAGGFVGTIGALLTLALPAFGSHLSKFVENLEPFIAGVDKVTEEVETGASRLFGIIVSMTAGSLVGAIGALFGLALPSFGTHLSQFMNNSKDFFDGLKYMNSDMLNAADALSNILMKLTITDVVQGIADWLGIDGNLSDFGKDLADLGPHLKTYAEAVKGIDTAQVEASARAASLLSDLANGLPTEGGLEAAIFGDTISLADFGANLRIFGNAMAAYATSVKDISYSSILNSQRAAQLLIDLEESLNADKSFWDLFIGDKTLDVLGSEMVSFGEAMKKFGDEISGADLSKTQDVVDSITAILEIANASVDVDLWDATAIVAKVHGLVTSMMTAFDTKMREDTDSGTSAEAIAYWMTAISDALDKTSSGGLVSTDVKDFATDIIKQLTDKVPDAETAGKDFGNKLGDSIVSGITEKDSDIKNSGEGITEQVFGGLRGAAAMTSSGMSYSTGDSSPPFKEAGRIFVNSVASGIDEVYTKVKQPISNMVQAAVDEAKSSSWYWSMYSAGAYVAKGLVDGLNSKLYSAARAAESLASTVQNSFRNSVQINSPSKVFFGYGRYIVEGLVGGMDRYSVEAENASALLAHESKLAMQKALLDSKMLIDKEDIRPRITPIIDLSYVKAGTKEMAKMIRDASVYSYQTAADAAAIHERSLYEKNKMIQNGLGNSVNTASDGGGGTKIENTFYLDNVTIREENDIRKLGRQLAEEQQKTLRGRGIRGVPVY